MIISNTHRAIFVHIPKTAGTSITNLIEPALRWNDLVLGGTTFGERIQAAYQERFGLSKHMRARDIRRVVGEELWANSFTFAIVRHPYARVASFYAWLRRALRCAPDDAPIRSWPHAQACLETGTVSEFIRHRKFLDSPLASAPQADWVCAEDGRCIVEFVGRFENLPESVSTIASRLGLGTARLERLNATAGESPAAEPALCEPDYDWLLELHRRDFDMFGYEPSLRL